VALDAENSSVGSPLVHAGDDSLCFSEVRLVVVQAEQKIAERRKNNPEFQLFESWFGKKQTDENR
jgi:hypothetical protein